ncbi:response regulator [Nonomuraea typhae]|uniref:Transcriptional regulatory protein n=1 Tax=Nonomuraea typhae TaxID=2603600 RepID=A0ABW7Z612_9ACTN
MIDVLVVDDDFMVAKVNSGFVGMVEGFRPVGAAHTAGQALSAVRDLRPDLVLLDLYLPDRFGLEVLACLPRECDVIVISAAREVETVRRAARHGVAGYLLKPFDFDDLRVRLEKYAAQRASRTITTQADVDRLLAGTAPRTTGTPPKGMSAETAGLVRQALAAGALSATECAARIGISRVSARRYLEHLAATGQATVSLRYGTTGRPERRYRLSLP